MSNNSLSLIGIILYFFNFHFILTKSLPNLKFLASEFGTIINFYSAFHNWEIDFSDNDKLIFEKISAFFSSDPPVIDNYQEIIEYKNVNITFVFDAKYTQKLNELYEKNITIQNKGLSFYLLLNHLRLARRVDNSFIVDKDILLLSQNHLLGNFQDYLFFQSLIENYGKDKFYNEFVVLCQKFINEILVFFPVCEAYENFMYVVHYLVQAGNFDITYPDEPTFEKLSFVSFKYVNIESVEPFIRKINEVSILVKYKRNEDYEKKVYFDYISFTRDDIIFSKMSPDEDFLEIAIHDLFRKALKLVLNSN